VPLAELGPALRNGTVAGYVFITPDLGHDIHDASGFENNRIRYYGRPLWSARRLDDRARIAVSRSRPTSRNK
jgi:hypothetical protein